MTTAYLCACVRVFWSSSISGRERYVGLVLDSHSSPKKHKSSAALRLLGRLCRSILSRTVAAIGGNNAARRSIDVGLLQSVIAMMYHSKGAGVRLLADRFDTSIDGWRHGTDEYGTHMPSSAAGSTDGEKDRQIDERMDDERMDGWTDG